MVFRCDKLRGLGDPGFFGLGDPGCNVEAL